MTERARGWKSGGLFGDDTDENAKGPLADDSGDAETTVSNDTPVAGYDPGEGGQTREHLISAVHEESGAAYDRPATGYAPEPDEGSDDYSYGEDDGDGDDEGWLDTALGYLGSPVGIAAAAVVLILVLLWIFLGRGGGEETSEAPVQQAAPPAAQQQGTQGAAPASEPEPAVRNTGIVIEKPTAPPADNACKGSYYLKAGAIAWCGELEPIKDVPDGELLKLEGATYAEFRRTPLDDVDVEEGSQMNGSFGRAEPGKPVLIGQFDRTLVGGTETTEGTYKLIDGDKLLLTGHYSDERQGGEVVRTYEERPPGAPLSEASVQKVKFEAPVGTPIPALIGREPSPLEEQGGQGE